MALVISSNDVECFSPALRNGFAAIDLTFNGQGPFSENAVAFELYPKAS